MRQKQPSERGPVQRQHERALVDASIAYYNEDNKTSFVFDCTPEPPDAIAKDGERVLWLEVADAGSRGAYQDEYSYATPGETHVPDPYGGCIGTLDVTAEGETIFLPTGFAAVTNPDEEFAGHFFRVLQQKLSKQNYERFHEQHGRGVLVIGVLNRLFGESTLEMIKKRFLSGVEGDLGYFGVIYIYDYGTIHRLG